MKVLRISEESLQDMMIKYFWSKWESDADKLNQPSYDFKVLSFILKSKH